MGWKMWYGVGPILSVNGACCCRANEVDEDDEGSGPDWGGQSGMCRLEG